MSMTKSVKLKLNYSIQMCKCLSSHDVFKQGDVYSAHMKKQHKQQAVLKNHMTDNYM